MLSYKVNIRNAHKRASQTLWIPYIMMMKRVLMKV